MLLEMLYNAASLDVGFFTGLVLDNLFWVFGFIAVAYFFGEKGFMMRLATILLMTYAMLDMQGIHGLSYYVGGSLMVLYFGRMTVLTAVATTKGAEKYLPLFYSVISYSVLFYFNFFG